MAQSLRRQKIPEQLKRRWTRVAFGDVVQLCRERSSNPAKDGFDRYVGLEHLSPGDLKIRRWGEVADGTTFTNIFRAGKVLFGKRRAYQRKVAVADFEGVCSGDIYVLEPSNDHLLTELLPFICQTDSFFAHAVGTSAGSLSPRTNWQSLAEYKFLLPPIEDQRRIADLLRIHLDSKESLHEAVGRSRVLRLSMLRSLFSTRIDGQISLTLDSLVNSGEVELQTGPFGTVLSAKEYRQSGWPIVNPTDMRDGQINHEGGPCVDDASAKRLEMYRLRVGDILLARKADLSKAVLSHEEHAGWIGGSDTIRLRCKSKRLLPEYLHLALQTPDAARTLYSYAHGTVMPGLNEKMLRQLVINLCSMEEQDAVVKNLRELERNERALREREAACKILGNTLLHHLLSSREVFGT